MSLLESAVLRLPHDLTFLIGLLAAIAAVLATTLWLLRRRQRKPTAPKTAPKPTSPTVTPPAVPGQKTLAERLKELDEIEERHRVRTIEEIAKYKKYTYDPLACASLEHFQPIKKNTHCVFAPASRIWGSYDYDTSVSIEENVKRSLPTFLRFIEEVQTKPIDGFCFFVALQPTTIEEFAGIVTRVMRAVSDHDPGYSRFMESEHIGRRGWYPQVNRQPFFVTTFGPCYPTNHSRFAFGAQGCYVLFQPDVSFGRHQIEDNHPDDPSIDTVRQKIRNIFKANNRAYYIPPSRFSPLAEHVVAAMHIGEKMHWWEYPKKTEATAEQVAAPDAK